MHSRTILVFKLVGFSSDLGASAEQMEVFFDHCKGDGNLIRYPDI